MIRCSNLRYITRSKLILPRWNNISSKGDFHAGVIGVAVTGLLLDASSDQNISSGWWQAFAACAVQCIVGSKIFAIAAKGHRLFGSDADN